MKKVFLFMLLAMLTFVSAVAQHWTGPTEYDYSASTPCRVNVQVNGISANANMNLELAAFIDGSCRATTNYPERSIYTLRVWGDATKDLKKTITFRAFYNGLEYEFTKTAAFTGETNEVVLDLKLDAITGVSLPEKIEIKQSLPYDYDLNDDIAFEYADMSGKPVEPTGESTLKSELLYEWDFSNSSSYFTVNNKNVLTAKAETEGSYLGLRVYTNAQADATGASLGFNATAFTNVSIAIPAVPVTNISTDLKSIEVYFDNYFADIESALKGHIFFNPENASNQNYNFSVVDADDNSVRPSNGGAFRVKVVAEDQMNKPAPIYIPLIVRVRPTGIETSKQVLTVNVGDNVIDEIKKIVTLTPKSDYLDDELVYSTTSSDILFNLKTGIAERVGQANVVIKPASVIDMQGTYIPSAEITLIVKKPVTSISVNPTEITVNVGDNVEEALRNIKVTITPNDATELGYENNVFTQFPNNGLATKAGTYRVTYTSKDNPNATAIVAVIVKSQVSFNYPTSLQLYKTKDVQFLLTNLEGDDFNPNLIRIEVPGYEDAATFVMADNTGLIWNARGLRAGTYNYQISYNGVYMSPSSAANSPAQLNVAADFTFNSDGWDWISVPANVSLLDGASTSKTYQSFLNIDANNRLIEVRSQTALLYNDPSLGFFGSITELTPKDGMYKIKTSYKDASKCVFNAGNIQVNPSEISSQKSIRKGYNWIAYPNEYDITVSEWNQDKAMIKKATEGDLLIGKDGFAEFYNGKWVAADGFSLKAGKGYIYYCDGEGGFYPSFDVAETASSKRRVARDVNSQVGSESVWSYDSKRFADNMAIVAEIECLNNVDNYSIGAFVGNECRGEGSAVEGGKIMICVAGAAGETVNFRLYNKVTGEYSDVSEMVKFEQKLGSLKRPVMLSADVTVTGIAGLEDKMDAIGIYDMSGRRVNQMTSGLYIVKTIENGKIVSKKVLK